MRGGRPGREGEEGVSGARGAWWQVRWLYLQLVVGAVDLLVVINLERLQELEVKGEAALHPDAVVAAQVRGVGLGVLQARDVARWLCVQLTAALGCGSRAGVGWSLGDSLAQCRPSHSTPTSPWQECLSCCSS